MRFDKEKLDAEILKSLGQWNAEATYVIRNTLDWPGNVFHRQGLKTSHVLTACRRLEKQGKIEEVGGYSGMKCWALTDEFLKDEFEKLYKKHGIGDQGSGEI